MIKENWYFDLYSHHPFPSTVCLEKNDLPTSWANRHPLKKRPPIGKYFFFKDPWFDTGKRNIGHESFKNDVTGPKSLK
jgi:hypothetical protein